MVGSLGGSVAGEEFDDGCEWFVERGVDADVGDTEVLAAPLQLLGHLLGVSAQQGQRVVGDQVAASAPMNCSVQGGTCSPITNRFIENSMPPARSPACVRMSVTIWASSVREASGSAR